MVFESWETKIGMVVLHGNVKTIRVGICRFFFFCVSVKVKIAEKKKKNLVKLRLKRTKIYILKGGPEFFALS